eukprot:scaffold49900_cov63-Phaeocystis_antarctica.AAC.4
MIGGTYSAVSNKDSACVYWRSLPSARELKPRPPQQVQSGARVPPVRGPRSAPPCTAGRSAARIGATKALVARGPCQAATCRCRTRGTATRAGGRVDLGDVQRERRRDEDGTCWLAGPGVRAGRHTVWWHGKTLIVSPCLKTSMHTAQSSETPGFTVGISTPSAADLWACVARLLTAYRTDELYSDETSDSLAW